MIIATLSYKVPLEKVDAHLEAHKAWLRNAMDQGLLSLAGRKVPRTGGVLLSLADRPAFEACVAQDPFSVHGVADYDLTEFAPTAADATFAFLLD